MRGRNLVWLWIGVFLALGDVAHAFTEKVQAEGVPPRIRGLLAALDDPDNAVVHTALKRLLEYEKAASSILSSSAKEHAPRLIDLLKDPDEDVRASAASALEAMGEAAKEHAPRIADLLKDPDQQVRASAASALGAMGEVAKEHAPRLADLLKDPNSGVRASTARALEAMGEAAKEHAPRLVDLLKDPNWHVRMSAASALEAMGEAAKEHPPRIADLLKDPNSGIRDSAARALGAMGEVAKEHAPRIADLLEDLGKDVRPSAVSALRAMGGAAKEHAPRLADLLKDPNWDVRISAEHALEAMAPLDLQSCTEILAMANKELSNRLRWLMSTHLAAGGSPQMERILRWLPRRTSMELPNKITIDEARNTLRAFAEFWPHTEKHPALRDDLAQQIARVANLARGQWERSDIELLEIHEENLKTPYPMNAETIRAAIAPIERWHSMRTFAWAWAGHIGFWLLLLFFYPRSAQVQAFFFWNPWVRTIMGFVYVGLLLTWLPFLRRRLLAPFQHLFLADAELERFSTETYFDRSEVLLQPSGRRGPLVGVLPCLRGQVVLEGASGLGKSMFIKHLLRTSKRLAVFLPAERCKTGVIEAIQAKLEGHAKDTAFLKSIIFSGALDIYIDGLNEVTADTRARIVQFVESNFHGNILLATQRMEWTPPATARLYVLQPLSEGQIAEFLARHEPLLEATCQLRGPEYHEVCGRFVQQALFSPEQPEELRRVMREVLSNPMDLTVVAQMLAEGHTPDPFNLRQQQYDLMARDYREKHLAEFPLKKFAEETYQMRLDDRAAIPEERFDMELRRMESFKMVVRREGQRADGKAYRDWRFRHDKLQEFFIAQTFLTFLKAGDPRIIEHMSDPRFRGVYLLLALLLELEKARELRDLLVDHAAETRDHTLSDDFVTLFKSRQNAEKVKAKQPQLIVPTGT